MSRATGEPVLFPAVRNAGEEALVVAPGFRCRHPIADFCDNRGSLHTAELLTMAGLSTNRRKHTTPSLLSVLREHCTIRRNSEAGAG